jgi:hypothetical protein
MPYRSQDGHPENDDALLADARKDARRAQLERRLRYAQALLGKKAPAESPEAIAARPTLFRLFQWWLLLMLFATGGLALTTKVALTVVLFGGPFAVIGFYAFVVVPGAWIVHARTVRQLAALPSANAAANVTTA